MLSIKGRKCPARCCWETSGSNLDSVAHVVAAAAAEVVAVALVVVVAAAATEAAAAAAVVAVATWTPPGRTAVRLQAATPMSNFRPTLKRRHHSLSVKRRNAMWTQCEVSNELDRERLSPRRKKLFLPKRKRTKSKPTTHTDSKTKSCLSEQTYFTNLLRSSHWKLLSNERTNCVCV